MNFTTTKPVVAVLALLLAGCTAITGVDAITEGRVLQRHTIAGEVGAGLNFADGSRLEVTGGMGGYGELPWDLDEPMSSRGWQTNEPRATVRWVKPVWRAR